MISNTGLKEQDREYVIDSLVKDARTVLDIAISDEGFLIDSIARLRTVASSINVKADKLCAIWEEQKKRKK